MCEKYHPDTQNRIGFDECYSMLAVVGAFHDFGASDEYEREAMAEELMQMCNR
jgi:hypothetical protein